MNFLRNIRNFFLKPHPTKPVDFSTLSRKEKDEFLKRSAKDFSQRYGSVIEKLSKE